VSWFRDAGSWLAGPFRHIFDVGDNRADIAVNWGIAAVVYSLIGGLVSRLLAGASAGGFGRRTTTV
jgi:hypothetical protein